MATNIEKTVYKVSDFLSWQRSGSLTLSPSFQRRSVWPKAAKSYLIDTVVRTLPMPLIFLREQTNIKTLEPIREVVDGQQRLRTLIAYIEPTSLKDYGPTKDSFVVSKTHNSQISGKTFSQLDEETRKRILNYSFSVHVLPSDTDDREILQIFARMNATGVKLNNQELRNAKYYGAFKSLSYELAYEQLTRWRSWKVFSENDIARMIEVEETSELIRMMLEGVQGKSQSALEKIYGKYESEFPNEEEVARRFRLVADKIDETFGDQIKSTAFSRKVLFHTLFTFYYDLMFGFDPKLEKKKVKSVSLQISTVLKEASDQILHGQLSEALAKVLRGATGNPGSRRVRLNFLREVCERHAAA